MKRWRPARISWQDEVRMAAEATWTAYDRSTVRGGSREGGDL
jgi:hypothetical protein